MPQHTPARGSPIPIALRMTTNLDDLTSLPCLDRKTGELLSVRIPGWWELTSLFSDGTHQGKVAVIDRNPVIDRFPDFDRESRSNMNVRGKIMKPSRASKPSYTWVSMLVVFVAVGGCNGKPTTISGSGGGGGSIKDTVAQYGHRDGQMVVTVWSDCAHIGGAGGGNDGLRSEHHGEMSGPDGRRVSWKCETPDGKTGAVRINAATYDLAKGPVFLVSTKGGETQVVQLQRDLSKLAPGQPSLEKLAKDDPDIAAFLAKAAKP